MSGVWTDFWLFTCQVVGAYRFIVDVCLFAVPVYIYSYRTKNYQKYLYVNKLVGVE